jgi:hypothetical protein
MVSTMLKMNELPMTFSVVAARIEVGSRSSLRNLRVLIVALRQGIYFVENLETLGLWQSSLGQVFSVM